MTKVLTQRAVETAKPKAKRYGRPDGLVPGLQLITQPSGSKSYVLFARIEGKLVNMRLGAAGVLTLAQARDQARAKLGLIAAGTDPRAAKRDARSAETFAEVAESFVERYAKLYTRNWQETERVLARDVLPKWGTRPIDGIVKADVIALLDRVVDRNAPIMANRVLATVRRIFSWCIERGTLQVSPCDRVKKPAPETARDRVLDDRELALVWAAADTLGYSAGPFVQLLILSGQRRCEVSDMTWKELDPALTAWVLPAIRVKNGVEHRIPISAAMRSVLASLPRIAGEAGYVFTADGKAPLSSFSQDKRNLDAAVTALNGGTPITAWTFHDLRRSLASGMARIGIGLPVVEKILNHSGGSFGGIQGIYQRHTFRDEMLAALENWGRHVAAIQLEMELRRGFAGR